jgi:hypothetical protein
MDESELRIYPNTVKVIVEPHTAIYFPLKPNCDCENPIPQDTSILLRKMSHLFSK